MKVLLIEADDSNRRLIREHLRKRGHSVTNHKKWRGAPFTKTGCLVISTTLVGDDGWVTFFNNHQAQIKRTPTLFLSKEFGYQDDRSFRFFDWWDNNVASVTARPMWLRAQVRGNPSRVDRGRALRRDIDEFLNSVRKK